MGQGKLTCSKASLIRETEAGQVHVLDSHYSSSGAQSPEDLQSYKLTCIPMAP
jgi:hypothetical protein